VEHAHAEIGEPRRLCRPPQRVDIDIALDHAEGTRLEGRSRGL
jgi:hypothetical protein